MHTLRRGRQAPAPRVQGHEEEESRHYSHLLNASNLRALWISVIEYFESKTLET